MARLSLINLSRSILEQLESNTAQIFILDVDKYWLEFFPNTKPPMIYENIYYGDACWVDEYAATNILVKRAQQIIQETTPQ
jgi:hypothetical protein